MDLHSQEAILRLTEDHDTSDLVVVLGNPDPESAEASAETVVSGDPSWAGPLAGVQLGLDVRHVLDPEIKAAVPDEVWEEQIGVMADVLPAEALTAAVAAVRDRPGEGAG
jgi:betaine reductase